MPEDGPATDNDSLASNSSSAASTDAAAARRVVAERLREAGVGDRRFIELQAGSKEPISHDQQEPHAVNGDYGVYAGQDLVLLDLDTYNGDPPDWVAELPPTFTVQSPHGGEHRYYHPEGTVDNTEFGTGSVRAFNEYVVGPGSELDSCSKEEHDCSQDGEGHYRILHDRPVASVSATVFPDGQRDTQDQNTDADVANVAADITDLSEVDAPFDKLEIRLDAFLDDEVRRALWEGRYSDAGFDDRSDAEGALAWHLGWFLDGEPDVVGQFMSLACNRFPQTDWGEPRKWLVRKNDSYREATLELPDYPFTYEPAGSRVGPRPEVSSVASEKVLTALGAFYPATTKEVANHELVDVCQEQTRKALVELMEYDVLAREKDYTRPNNPYVYYPAFEDEINSN